MESFGTWGIARAHLTKPCCCCCCCCCCPPSLPSHRTVPVVDRFGRRCVGLVSWASSSSWSDAELFLFVLFFFSSFFSSLVYVLCVCVCCRSRAGSLLSTLWSSSNNRIEITGSGVSDRKNWSESLPFRKKKRIFSFSFFPCLYFYVCIFEGGGDACDGNHSVCFRLFPVELWLWIVSVRSWLPSAFCFLVPVAGAAKRKMQKQKTREEIEDLKIVHRFWPCCVFLQGAYPARLRKVLIVTAPL